MQGRELTHTTIFKKNYHKGENKHIPHYLQTNQGRELTLISMFTKLIRGEN